MPFRSRTRFIAEPLAAYSAEETVCCLLVRFYASQHMDEW